VAQAVVRAVAALDKGLILAPERYDPRRHDTAPGQRLAELATVVREQVTPAKAGESEFLVLDTTDAREGAIVTYKETCRGDELGSTKKLTQPGDVIISRLRPYLRQVGLVDAGLAEPRVQLACSTEFYVLRPRSDSIGFLVPFLLSSSVQAQLAAAQEGGHHPRFNQETLENLSVPDHIVAQREELSKRVETAAAATRAGQVEMLEAVAAADRTPE
jgi:hypothetical protein